jgi:dienelactone hydrolase
MRRCSQILRGSFLLGAWGLIGCEGAEPATSQQPSELRVQPSSRVVPLVLDNGDHASVYVPADAADDAVGDAVGDAADDAPRERYPIVVHLQGGSVDAQHYAGYGHGLARAGFVAVIPNHLRSFGPPGTPPSPLTEGQVVAAAVRAVARASEDPRSPLFARADVEHIALTGHSFGGVVGLNTVAGRCMPPFCTPPLLRPAIRAAAFFGSHLVVDGKVDSLSTQGVPVALLSGLEDGRALPSQIRATSLALSGPVFFVPLAGVNHYGITDENPPPGATLDPRPQPLDQARSVQQIARTVAAFLRVSLRRSGPRPPD